jgi:hypothetical protein
MSWKTYRKAFNIKIKEHQDLNKNQSLKKAENSLKIDYNLAHPLLPLQLNDYQCYQLNCLGGELDYRMGKGKTVVTFYYAWNSTR